MSKNLEIDLELLKTTDNYAPLMREIEQIVIKLIGQTRKGRRISGIVILPSASILGEDDIDED